MKKIEQYISVGMLFFAIGFNLWLYRLEPTALVDPNDNHFQYALVDRTNQIWDFAYKTCSKNIFFPFCHVSYLIDHWVPNWAQGYNLPYYYSHLPQIAIVTSWRLFHGFLSFLPTVNHEPITLFQYYHLIIYLLLCLFPVSVFFALRVLGLSWLTAGFGGLLATHISTDGLYGLDPPSFLWRGYGLSSQLFAMIWLPLALAYSYRFLSCSLGKGGSKQFLRELGMRLNVGRDRSLAAQPHLARNGDYLLNHVEGSQASRKNLFANSFAPAVFFLFATTAGHLGIGIIALFSTGIIAISEPIMLLLTQQSFATIVASTKQRFIRLSALSLTTLFFLSYWVLPLLLHNNFHNISVWDPIWKFNSYGAKETIVRFLNGELFDFGRFPVFTLLVLVGFFALLTNYAANLLSFSLLFVVWFLLYFGRTTWGGLVDLVPGMKEFHISRFIVGLHAAGFFLAPIGLSWLVKNITSKFKRFSILPNWIIGLFDYLIIGLLLIPIYLQTIAYSAHNDRLIRQANDNATRVRGDVDLLFATLRSLPPGRVFAGRGGSWGKDFRVAETPFFMHLSTYGIPTVLWLPETWSPNSDTEQYFSEDQEKDYDLYNIRYVVTPPAQKVQPFWKLLKATPTWKLYQVRTSGYFIGGVRPAVVATDKESFTNVVRLWIQSDNPKKGLYPQLSFAKDYPKPTGLANFQMLDEVTYLTPDNKKHNLFSEPPLYLPIGFQSKEQFDKATRQQYTSVKLTDPERDQSDMVFKTTVTVEPNCAECILVLKETFHPNWKATIDGKPAPTFTVFPFYIGVPLNQPGSHDIVVWYAPSPLKLALLISAFLTIATLVWARRRNIDKP